MEPLPSIIIPGLVQPNLDQLCICGGNCDETQEEHNNLQQKITDLRTGLAPRGTITVDSTKLLGHAVVLSCGDVLHSRCMENCIAAWRDVRANLLLNNADGDLPELDCPMCHTIIDSKLIPPALPPTLAFQVKASYSYGREQAPAIATSLCYLSRFITTFGIACAFDLYSKVFESHVDNSLISTTLMSVAKQSMNLATIAGTYTASCASDVMHHLNQSTWMPAFKPLRNAFEPAYRLTVDVVSIADSWTSWMLPSLSYSQEDVCPLNNASTLHSTTEMIDFRAQNREQNARLSAFAMPWVIIGALSVFTLLPLAIENRYNRNIHCAMLLFGFAMISKEGNYLTELGSVVGFVGASYITHRIATVVTRALAARIEPVLGHNRLFRQVVGRAYQAAFLVNRLQTRIHR